MSLEGLKIFTFRSREDLAQMLTEKFQDLIGDSIGSGRGFNVALSGGSTPRIIFEYIVSIYRDSNFHKWENVRFYWVDERCVPPDHPESNYRMANDTVLRYLPLPNNAVFRIKGEKDPHTEAERYSQLLSRQLPLKNKLPVFDLVLLGIGKDGHTASIFPDQMELLRSNKICAVSVHPESGQRRLTLTGKVINNADHVFFLVTGKDKARTVAEILDGGLRGQTYPAFHIKPAKGNLFWFLDTAAAKLLPKQNNPGSQRG